MLDGWIILDKPSGITSAQAVARVKKIVERGAWSVKLENAAYHASPSTRHVLKIGHAGTLDPLASGILPLALGEATKTVPYMMDAAKTYSFTVTWGEERDTDDREGKITAVSEKHPTEEEINTILPKFIGEIEQIPPQFSALKVSGERAYDLAREGKVAELKARKVNIYHIESLEDQTPQQVRGSNFLCHCGKGTYIRSLARDMGRMLGCYGHISVLRRLKVGKFDETCAISLEILEKMVHKGDLSFLLPVESALDDIPALDINPSQAILLRQGRSLSAQPPVSHETVLAKSEGKAVAICNVSQGQMKPVRVFNL